MFYIKLKVYIVVLNILQISILSRIYNNLPVLLRLDIENELLTPFPGSKFILFTIFCLLIYLFTYLLFFFLFVLPFSVALLLLLLFFVFC